MTNMDYILAVAQEKSFSKAAKKLFVSQPALSAAVIKYEKEIGTQLFDRSTSPIQLTEAGKMYLKAAHEIIAIQTELECFFQDLSKLHTGTLRVGGTFFSGSCFLPYFISEFTKMYPGIQFTLVEGSSVELEQMVLNGEIDFMVDSRSEHTDYGTDLFTCTTLLKDSILLAVPTQCPLNQELQSYQITADDIYKEKYLDDNCPEVTLNLFASEPFLFLNPGNNMYDKAMELCNRSGFIPNIKMYFNQIMTTHYMTTMGIGSCFVTSVLVKNSNFLKHPVYYKIKDTKAVRDIVILSKKNKYISQAMQAFIEILQKGSGFDRIGSIQHK